MPVLKRTIEPKNVSRRIVPPNTSNELEFISNSTLAHVIFQLSSLSKHSEDLFGELHRETCCILYRTSQLNERIEHLKMKIVRLNPTVEEVSLHDINMRKPFKSSVMKENQIIGVNTRPHAIAEVYRWVEPAPSLRILNAYRDDGKDSLKFYTDPGYFFELWSLEITKDAENQVKKHKHRKGRTMRPTKEPPTMRQPKLQHDTSKDHLTLQRPESADRLLQRAHTVATADQRKPPQVSSPSKKAIGSLPKVQRGSSQGRYDRASVTSSHQSSPGPASPRQFVYPNGSTSFEMRDDRIKDHASPSRQVRQMLPSGDRPSGSPPHPPSSGVRQSNRTNNPDRNLYWDGPPLPPNATLPLARSVDDRNYSIAGQQMPAATLDRSVDHDHFAIRQQRPHEHDSPRSRARDSMDLPPPPLTPPAELPQSYEPMPSPPPIPSPVLDYPPSGCPIPGSPLLPPPPPLYDADFSVRDEVSVGFSSRVIVDKYFQGGDGSVTGENAEEDVGQTADGNDTEGDRDHRSDLLAAIKKGIQLRKVEERRLKTAHRQKMPSSQGHLDVQSIMEAAFEMRRKALEENDSEDDDDDEEEVTNWSDDN